MECISYIQDSGFKTVSFPFTIINDVIETGILLFKIICVLANFLILLDTSLFVYVFIYGYFERNLDFVYKFRHMTS